MLKIWQVWLAKIEHSVARACTRHVQNKFEHAHGKATPLGKYLNLALCNNSLEIFEINKELVQSSAEYVNYCTMPEQETREERKARIIKRQSVESFLIKTEHSVARARLFYSTLL